MATDSLLDLVEELCERIAVHGRDDAFRQSEMQTRYALIDPLLRELEWHTERPTEVRPEFQVKGKADYALLIGGKPVVMGEAKRLREKNLEDARQQGLRYCTKDATRYLFTTNGRRWEIYDTYKKDVSTPTVQFDLEKDTADEVCKKAQMLQRNRLKKNQQPLSIAEWNPPPKSRPAKVQFPDTSAVQIETWKALLVELTRWLINNQHLTNAHYSIRKTKNSGRYAVHTEPVHPNGNEFRVPGTVELSDGGKLYVDADDRGDRNALTARNIIEHVGQDPARFTVWFT